MKKLTILCGLLSIALISIAQSDLSIDISTIKTQAKNNAIGLGINYLKQYNNLDFQSNGKRGFINITPEIITQAGTNDAFSQLQLKLSGYFFKAKTTTVAGLETFDRTKTYHIFPLAIGLESNSEFSFVNTIFEAGYIPFYQGEKNTSVSDFVKFTKLGLFFQAGYKGMLDTANAIFKIGGNTDESKEAINKTILRFKGTFSLDSKNFFTNKEKPGIGLIGNATYWYDFINKQIYYRVEGKIRLYLSPNRFFDLKYEKGSGAPNFNQGEQFSTGLSINF